jgi:HemY protein
MILFLALLLIVFAAGVGAMVMLHPDAGYVLINYGPFVIETTAAALVLSLLLALLLIWLLLKLFGIAIRLPGSVREALDQRRSDRAQRSFESGLMRLWEGDWTRAEGELVKRAGDHRAPHLNYLAAARAAHRLDAPERRDHYLKLAAINSPEHEFTTLLSQADLQRKRGEFAATRATALKLRERKPAHPFAIELLAESYYALGDWTALRALLAEPAARTAIVQSRQTEFWLRALVESMDAAVAEASLPKLKALWDEAGSYRSNPDLRRHYVRGLSRLNADREAAALIEQALATGWDPALALFYGDLHMSDAIAQLATVEQWLGQYSEKPELLQVAGRVCLKNRLWGKARSYLEAVIAQAPTPKAYLDLARLCADTQQPEDATKFNRLGLELATQS